jgi:ATP-dependent DNA helicase Q4
LLFPGLTLVVSPLLALMADQLRGLPPALPGAALRSDQSQTHLFAVLDEMRAGKLKVLFVSPERLLNERFLNDLRLVPGGVSLAVVDEAHCVSEWSHNFRPAYHRLGRVLRSRLRVRGPVLALTATATKRTETSLRSTLDIPEEGAFRDDAIRANLTLSAMRVPASAREATLKHLLQREPMRGVGSAIVYVAFQNQAETVAAYLQTNGVNAKAYHAGQEPKDRQRTQAQFFAGSVRVVVATVAFGMGLDKADVRAVINYSLPRSPEAYIQQAGRAGRDGLPARCVSFIDADDFTRLRSLSFSDGVDRAAVHKLLETVFLGRDRKARSALAALAPGGGVSAGEPRDAEGGPEKFGRDPNPNPNENRDSGNEVAEPAAVGALIVQQLEREMDMRGEVIETVLSCLELWDARVIERRCAEAKSEKETNKESDASRATLAATETARACPPKNSENGDDDFGALGGNGLVRVLPDMRATCELSFHGASPEALAGVCPLVAAVLALGAKPKAGTYRFSVAAAARSMRSGLEEVGAQLQALSANGDAAYRLSDRAVGYEILRAPPADLRPLASALAAHLAAVERSAVHKLDTVYAALEHAANAEDDHAQSASLRGTLEAYLRGVGPGSAETPSGVDLSGVIAADAPRGLAADVRELLTHRSGGKAGGAGCMSARAVARVLHGLGSPAYPAAEWRRKEKAGNLWEKHSKVDFGAIVRVASEELLAMRGVVPKKKP